jgi:N-acetylneuraminic acid mutarotase
MLIPTWLRWILPVLLSTACGQSSPTTPPDDTPTEEWWTSAATFGGDAVRGSVAFTIGESAYVVSGLVDGVGLVRATWRYESAENRWTRVADFPGTPRLDGSGFAVGGKGYVALGSDNVTMLADVWEYDPTTDRWNQKASFPDGSLTLASVVVVGTKAYVITGMSPSGPTRGVWEYDPSVDRWARKTDFPGSARSTACAFALGGLAYFGLGAELNAGATWVFQQDFWQYDASADRWTRRADFPGAARVHALGLGLGTRGFVTQGLLSASAGGSSLTLAKDLWEYNPGSDTWTQRSDLPGSGRAMAVGFVIGSSGYVALGNDQSVTNLRDVWRLTPR